MDLGTDADRRSVRGRAGEDAALRVYVRRGFRLLDRNWRCRAGELDLVVVRDGLLVFCEVKTRTGDAFGGGYEAVTRSKLRKLRQLAECTSRRTPAARRRALRRSERGSGEACSDVDFEDASEIRCRPGLHPPHGGLSSAG
jgi:Holliday junction resolvase-like predicted endonuclease